MSNHKSLGEKRFGEKITYATTLACLNLEKGVVKEDKMTYDNFCKLMSENYLDKSKSMATYFYKYLAFSINKRTNTQYFNVIDENRIIHKDHKDNFKISVATNEIYIEDNGNFLHNRDLMYSQRVLAKVKYIEHMNPNSRKIFVTLTLPSKYHKFKMKQENLKIKKLKDGTKIIKLIGENFEENPNYGYFHLAYEQHIEESITFLNVIYEDFYNLFQKKLRRYYKKMGYNEAAIKRLIKFDKIKMIEPHKSYCPHLHFLWYLNQDLETYEVFEETMKHIIKKYELDPNFCKLEEIKSAKTSTYVAKYIIKNTKEIDQFRHLYSNKRFFTISNFKYSNMNEILYVYKYLNKNNKEFLNELKRTNVPIFVEIEQLILSKTFVFEKQEVKRVVTHKKKYKAYEENLKNEISTIFNQELEAQKEEAFEYKTPFGISKTPLIEYLYLFFNQKREVQREVKIDNLQLLNNITELVKWYELQKGYDPSLIEQNTPKNTNKLVSLSVPISEAIDVLLYALLQFYLGNNYLTRDGNIDLAKFTFGDYKISLDEANYYCVFFSSPRGLSQEILQEIDIAKQFLIKMSQDNTEKENLKEEIATTKASKLNIEHIFQYFSPLQRKVYQDYTQSHILEQDYSLLQQNNIIKIITKASMNQTFDLFTKKPNDNNPLVIFQADSIYKIEVKLNTYHQFLDEFNYKEEDYFFNKIKKQLNFYIPPSDNIILEEKVA